MKNLTFPLLVALIVFFSATATSADAQKVTVSVNHSGSDGVGERLAFNLKEAIRGSNGYELATGANATFRIGLVTLNPERDSNAAWTVASYVISMKNVNPFKDDNPQTWYPILITSGVVTSGTQRVKETAEGILADLDAAIEQFRKDAVSKE